MDRKVEYSSTDSTDSESPPPKSASKSKESDKHSDRHRKKDRHHEKKSKHRKQRRESRDDRDKSKRRYKNDDDDSMSRRNKDRKDSRSDRDLRKSDDRKVRDKRSRRHDEKKRKHRHRSKSPAKSRRARSSSSSKSPEREKKSQLKPVENHVKPLLVASTSSSPQKSPMISLTSVQQVPPEPKIELPAYYNPNVINVTKFAEQQKKRKLIWSSKKEEPAKDAAKWGGAKFSQDSDGTKASKFMRLMGIKDAPKPEPSAAPKPSDELFSTMEQQYEVARQVTHISRGVGLGFGSRPF